MRALGNSDMPFWEIAFPLLLLQGIGMPFFFVSINGLALRGSMSLRPPLRLG
ncbi:hypothetical protein [Pseudomonas syringae]|uniref:hypothetical protein n=1 Tax=Pseudomonas syringae TaxID=317 RepID=UPI001372C299|nr:hypothetical protein [Pseudomonas syringae]